MTHRPGMTLAELLVTMVIFGLVITILITSYIIIGRIVSTESAKSTITLGTGRLLGPLDELLRQGVNIEPQYPPAPQAATVTTGTDALVFTIPSLDPSSEASTDHQDYVTLVRDTSLATNPRLIMTVYPDGSLPSTRPAETKVIASNVEDIYLRYPTIIPTDTNEVSLTIRLSRTERGSNSKQTIILSGLLRNH